jgi:hypothetical protein
VTVTNNAASFGDIPGKGAVKASLDSFGITVSAECPTRHEVSFNLNIADANGGAWTVSFQVTVYTSSQISGQVVKATGGAAIPDATVTYTGPVSGAVTSGVDGAYTFRCIDGAYALVARASGYSDSDPVQAIVPPDQSGVNIVLGRSDIDLTPATLLLTAEEGLSGTTPLVIRNLGDVRMDWSVASMSDYVALTSDQAGGPVYSWIEIAGTGTEIIGLGADVNVGFFDIGFTFAFPFYGQCHRTFRLSSNGYLSFTSVKPTDGGAMMRLPSGQAPANLVAFLWDDLDPSQGGSIWYQLVDANTLVVEFVDPDDDNDGMSDADEAVAGTNPTNALSVLRIVNSAFRAPSSEFVISWQSASNRRYRVQAATNLLSGFTLNLRTNILAIPPENVHTDSVSGAGMKFYRILVYPVE